MELNALGEQIEQTDILIGSINDIIRCLCHECVFIEDWVDIPLRSN